MDNEKKKDLFRSEALVALSSNRNASELLRPPAAWTWWISGGVLLIVASSFAIAALASVEVNVRAPAIVQSEGGVRPVFSQVSGVISFSEPGAAFKVKSGGRIAAIDVATHRSQLLENDRELALLGPGFQDVAAKRDRLHNDLIRNVNERLATAQTLVQSLGESLERQSTKLSAIEELAASQLVGTITVVDARETYAQSERQLESGRQSLAALRQELAAAVRNREDDLWAHDSQLRAAEARREAMLELETQSNVLSPIAGYFETALLTGEAVQGGQNIGRVVPEGNTQVAVAFLAEKDRAFVEVGDEVRLELSQLPYGEFGTLGARVTRISPELAEPDEITRILGMTTSPGVQSYRVDLYLHDITAAQAAGLQMKGGMLTQARFSLRRQRVAAIILEPLRRWLR